MALDTGQFGSLDGTLTGQNVLSQMQALAEAHQAALAQSAAAAAQSAGAAQSDYTQAANAPAPQLNPADVFLPTLLSNIASVIAQDPSYKQHNQQNLAQERQGLLQRRTENLQALHEVYQQKAEQATKLGDLEATEKYRTKMEVLTKTLDVLSKQSDQAATRQRELDVQGLKNAGDIAQERVRQAGETQRAKDKATADATSNLNDYVDVRNLPDGSQVPYFDGSRVPSIKARQKLTDDARKAGVSVVGDKEKSAFQLLDSVRGDLDYVRANIIPKLPEGDGFARMGGAAKNQWSAFIQSDADLAGYPAIRSAAIKTVQTLASLGKGLRINQAEIAAAQNFDYPKITDNQRTANNKFQVLGMMADHIEQAALGHPPTPEQVKQVMDGMREIRRSQGGPGTQGSGSAPGARNAALKAASSDELRRLIQSNPGLDTDPQVIAAARKLKANGK